MQTNRRLLRKNILKCVWKSDNWNIHRIQQFWKAFTATMKCIRKIWGLPIRYSYSHYFQSRPFFLYLRFMKETLLQVDLPYQIEWIWLFLRIPYSLSMFLCAMIIHFLFFLNMGFSLSPTSDVCKYCCDAYINHEK